MTVHAVVARFLDRITSDGTADPVELCDRDVVVVDGGREYHGADGLRRWRDGVAGARHVVRRPPESRVRPRA